ncbi:hypothetical protein [Aureibaculum luteum]|uniref:hypothetical protein n=1 Tax=Aureibaculum luteum TaxID=1548456 RepID=UPI00130042AA|nr:hypothetical protein [Aureibaculum luteum]
MEKLIEFLSEILYKASLTWDGFIRIKVSKNNNTIIGFLVLVFILPTSLSVSLAIDTTKDFYKFYYFLGFLILNLIFIIILATYYTYKKKKKSRFYNLKIRHISIHKIDYNALILKYGDKENFQLLLRNRKVNNKINYQIPNKSKTSANHRYLFTLFHLLIKGGIINLSPKSRDDFFRLLQESILMDGENINAETLNSSFSAWKSEFDSQKINDYIKELKIILNIP